MNNTTVSSLYFRPAALHRFPYQSVWEYIRNSVNLIPFKTIWDYAVDVAVKPWMLGIAIRNVLGNLVLFYPMGMCLPCLFPRIRTLKQTVLISLCTILSVEIIQIIFRRGIFDIDELVVNNPSFKKMMEDGVITEEELKEQSEKVLATLHKMELAYTAEQLQEIKSLLSEASVLYAVYNYYSIHNL